MLKNLEKIPKDLKDFLDSHIKFEENRKYFYFVAALSPFFTNFIKSNPDSISFILKHLDKNYSKFDYLEFLKEIPFSEYKKFYLSNVLRIFIKDIFQIEKKDLCWQEHSYLIEALLTKLFEDFKKENPQYKDILDKVFILAMGKLSSYEINYRSDIDLIFVYADSISKKDRFFFDNIIKLFIEKLEKYFFIDLRLRPFGSKGPLIISLEDLENYFFKFARPWEKLAYFRSRIILGPLSKKRELENLINQFVFSSLDDIGREIVKLKNLLLEYKEKTNLINIKEGVGGIRYIEFLAQGLSLIFHPKIKEPLIAQKTPKLLELLNFYGIILKEEKDFLIETYYFYRDIEHFLQIKEFKPRYSFHPESEESCIFAKLLGYTPDSFRKKLEISRKKVKEIFERYFEEKREDIYFSTLTKRKLKLLGFKNYEKLFEIYQNVISSKGILKDSFEKIDKLFSKLLPYILEGKYKDNKFKNFLKIVQNPYFLNYFYQLKDDEKALKILTYILEADYFTDILLEYPELSEEVFMVNFLNPSFRFPDLVDTILNTKEEKRKKLKKTYELSLYLAYKLSNIDITKLAFNYSLLTHAFIYAIAKKLETKASIYALGKLGGYELLFFGDLDLIFISKNLEEKEENLKLLPKLVEKLKLLDYEIDLRLRPYGNQSEIAPPLSYYKKYFEKVARLWERLAYTKAKDIYLKLKEFEDILKNFLFKKDLTKDDLDEILTLLDKLITTYQSEDPIKYSYGGLVALEFIGYTYQLFYKFKEPNLFKVLNFISQDIKIDFTKDYIFLKKLELEKKLQKDNFYLLEEEKAYMDKIKEKVENYFNFLKSKLPT